MKLKNSNGFTLIELLIVIGIIAVLAAIAVVSMSEYRSRAIESSMHTEIRNFSMAMETLFTDCYDYNPLLSGQTTGPGTAELRSGVGTCTSMQRITVGVGNTINIPNYTTNTYAITVANLSSRTNKRCIAMKQTGSYAWGADCPAAIAALP